MGLTSRLPDSRSVKRGSWTEPLAKTRSPEGSMGWAQTGARVPAHSPWHSEPCAGGRVVSSRLPVLEMLVGAEWAGLGSGLRPREVSDLVTVTRAQVTERAAWSPGSWPSPHPPCHLPFTEKAGLSPDAPGHSSGGRLAPGQGEGSDGAGKVLTGILSPSGERRKAMGGAARSWGAVERDMGGQPWEGQTSLRGGTREPGNWREEGRERWGEDGPLRVQVFVTVSILKKIPPVYGQGTLHVQAHG